MSRTLFELLIKLLREEQPFPVQELLKDGDPPFGIFPPTKVGVLLSNFRSIYPVLSFLSSQDLEVEVKTELQVLVNLIPRINRVRNCGFDISRDRVAQVFGELQFVGKVLEDANTLPFVVMTLGVVDDVVEKYEELGGDGMGL